MAQNGLHQLNTYPNSKGKYLDLLLCSTTWNVCVHNPMETKVLDKSTAHHYATSFAIFYSQAEAPEALNLKFSRTKLADTHKDLLAHTPSPITDEDISDVFFVDEYHLHRKIETFTLALQATQSRNTRVINKSSPTELSTHPWTRNKKYKELFAQRKSAKNNHLQFNTTETKLQLNQLNIALYELYNTLKHKYYNKILNEAPTDPRTFYRLMKSKLKLSSQLPATLVYDDTHLTGNCRYEAMLTHLKSCFVNSIFEFSPVSSTLAEQITDIYRGCYSSTYETHWENFLF